MAQADTRIAEFELASKIAGACMDAKGIDLTVLDVSEQSDIAKFFLIVSGRSDRQAQGIANRVVQILSERGLSPESIEGYEEGHWILLDCKNVVVHVFYEPVRERYDLEGLWMKAKKLDTTQLLAA